MGGNSFYDVESIFHFISLHLFNLFCVLVFKVFLNVSFYFYSLLFANIIIGLISLPLFVCIKAINICMLILDSTTLS